MREDATEKDKWEEHGSLESSQGPCNPSRSSIALKNIKKRQRFECKEERRKNDDQSDFGLWSNDERWSSDVDRHIVAW